MILLGLFGLLFRLAMIVLPIWFGVYIVIRLRRIDTSLQQINETLRRRVG